MTSARAFTCDDIRDLAPLYVLGALERDEEAAIAAHLETCPDAHAELAELGGVVPSLLTDVDPVEPPAGLKARVLAAAAADLESRAAIATGERSPAAVPSSPIAPVGAEASAERLAVLTPPPSSVVPLRRTPIRRFADWGVRLAAVLAIVALGAWNLSLQGRLDDTTADRAAFAAVLELAARDGSTTAVLTGEARGLAAVGQDGEVRFAFDSLAPTIGDEVYTAWAIAGEGASPVPVGEFRVDADGLGVLATTVAEPGSGLTLAITKEPAPGARIPTLPIRASGTTTG